MIGSSHQQVGSTPFINPVGAIEQVNTTGSEYDALLDQGINVYSHQGVPHSLHHKYCIIDHDEPAADPVITDRTIGFHSGECQ